MSKTEHLQGIRSYCEVDREWGGVGGGLVDGGG